MKILSPFTNSFYRPFILWAFSGLALLAGCGGGNESTPACPTIPNIFEPAAFGATAVALPIEASGRTDDLASFEANFDCSAPAGSGGGAADASVPSSDLVREAGCGRVVFRNAPPSWPRVWVFDATSGTLVGAAQADDVGTMVGACTSVSYVFGEAPPTCATVETHACMPLP